MTYVNEILDEIITASKDRESNGPSGLHLFDLFKVACEEIEKLNVIDFPPDKRFLFTMVRQKYRKLGRMGIYSGDQKTQFITLSIEVKALLKFYGSFGSQMNSRNFNFIIDKDLKSIIERDYAEFNNILIPDNAWKSSVVLAGSILEAILYDVLENPKYYTTAMAAKKTPKDKSGTLIDLKTKEWKLFALIEVSEEIGLLPSAKSKAIDQILRDYRNFVHPKKEIRSQFPCTEAEAFLAKGALDSVLNHFETVVP
jgi:ABC-type antimicrobial peptide transport system permease subunit